MKTKNLAQNSLLVAAVVGSLVLLNLLALRFFGRADLTSDHLYTLSKASKDTLAALDDQVTVTGYFSDNLPAPYSSNARYVRDLLEEYRAASKGKLSFELLDPAAQESAKDKETKRETKRDIFGRSFREPTEMEKELASEGIQPVEIRVIEEDQQQTKRAYMGLVIRHGEKKETIPVVQSVASLEYDLTSLIRRLTRTKTPVIGLLQGHGEPAPDHLRALQGILGENYEVKPVQPAPNATFDASIDAIFVLGPKQPVDDKTQQALDQFVMQGKSVGFFLDNASVDLKTFQPTATAHGLTSLLETWGVKLGDQLVADVSSANLNVTEQRGYMTVSMPVPYPFIPLVRRLEGDSAISKGISEVTFPFATTVSATAEEGRQVAVLARSSTKSWLEQKPPNLDPRRDWQAETITPTGPYPLMVQVSGKLKSHYAAMAQSSSANGAPPMLSESSSDARVIVAGTSSLFQDEFMNNRGNAALLLNCADWLALDPAMLAMRTRGLSMAPLQTDLPDGVRHAVKFGNALGLPVLLALFGLVRWRMREARRLRVAP